MISFRYRTIIARKEKIFRKPDENLFLMVLYTHGDDKMNQIEKARLEIDSVDKEIARLYEKRLDAVKEVLEYKKANLGCRQGRCDHRKESEVYSK